jgi:MOSC domain-containing protein YiiM
MDGKLQMKYLSTGAIEAQIEAVLASPKDEGTLRLIVRRPKVNARETVEAGTLTLEDGLVGDNWRTKGNRWRRGGDPKRQLTVMNWRFARLIAIEEDRIPLAGDQLYVDLDLSKENVPPGRRIKVGEAVIEVTEPPHLGCKKFVERFGADAMTFANSEFGRLHNLRGVNAKVVMPGDIATSDRIVLMRE